MQNLRHYNQDLYHRMIVKRLRKCVGSLKWDLHPVDNKKVAIFGGGKRIVCKICRISGKLSSWTCLDGMWMWVVRMLQDLFGPD